MAGSRIKIIGEKVFNAREWLRREVLWASLMSPYPQQLDRWLDGRAVDQHNGNVSRRDVYRAGIDIDSQALAFFNQGKNLAGIVSHAIVFQSAADGYIDKPVEEMLEIQSSTIEKTLGRVAINEVIRISDEKTYKICEHLARLALSEPHDRDNNLNRAGYVMTELASAEASIWLLDALQNEDSSLPILQINDGGHPRSAGDRVDKLQPVFQKIIASERYQALI
jgi:hypothetical protein